MCVVRLFARVLISQSPEQCVKHVSLPAYWPEAPQKPPSDPAHRHLLIEKPPTQCEAHTSRLDSIFTRYAPNPRRSVFLQGHFARLLSILCLPLVLTVSGGFKVLLQNCSPSYLGRPFRFEMCHAHYFDRVDRTDLEVGALLGLITELLINCESNQKQLVCTHNYCLDEN